MPIKIKAFDFRNAKEEEFARLSEFRNKIRAERLPDDPPIPVEELVQALKNKPSVMDLCLWAAWLQDESAVVAYGEILLPLEENLHLAQIDINVLPEYRRQGLGRQLLSKIVDVARREKRVALITNTADPIPAGEASMNRLNAKRGLESHTNQLVIAELDRSLLRQWQKRAKERAAGFEIGLWEGKYPEEDIDAIVALHDLLNQQPFGELDVEDFQFSPERLRETEQSIFARGYERWTLYVREISTSKFAGYTELLWNPNRPEIISQGMTGVFPEYRDKGLGRWLKAEMLDKTLKDRPQAKYIRTMNADANAPMLKINTELGFEPYIGETLWQIETEQALKYLDDGD
jgi:GNAT superfamily N-acetyltransferase